jgi:RNA polymerase sigma-70 factor, ECF subfamily
MAMVLDGERRSVVLAALGSLPAEQKAALVLVDMEGYPVAEAAQILDCATGTVKSRCSRGRARLAPLLRELLEGNPGPGSRVTPDDRSPTESTEEVTNSDA